MKQETIFNELYVKWSDMNKIICSMVVILLCSGIYYGKTESSQDHEIKELRDDIKDLNVIEKKIDTLNSTLNQLLLRIKR